MFLLLLIAATVYFILGEPRDGIVMLFFVLCMISIESIQGWKTDKTLNALKDLSSPKVNIIRDNQEKIIASEELVPGDIMIIYEGVKISADGIILETTGICMNEASLTGESEGKWKTVFEREEQEYFKSYCVYAGTICLQGKAYVEVIKIGTNTEYGKIGNAIINEKAPKTLLEKQISRVVKICSIIAFVLFIGVGVATFITSKQSNLSNRIIESILSGITLAMAMIPEEFPVVLMVFLSMGTWRLAKKNALVKKLPAVETLGAVSVLCVDKTGTITKNEMHVESAVYKFNEVPSLRECKMIVKAAALASLKEAFDPMEIAIHQYRQSLDIEIDEKEVFYFPFTNENKLMGNEYLIDDMYHLYVKGAYETVISLCSLSRDEIKIIEEQVMKYSANGLRILAIAKEESSDLIKSLENRAMEFLGLVTFIDPERDTIKQNIETCKRAGIRIIMITGDNGHTASAIARRIGIENSDDFMTGQELDTLSDEEIKERLKTINIFSRVIPDHKKKIVRLLQECGEVVAMTGDGVNDAPALKLADIGIAMGLHGSEVSREAADLVLLDDNFHTIVKTIEDGRRIYDNIKKAIGYIFTIHIPIALSSLIAPIIGIGSEFLFLLPLHVVLMELLIDPTCSIVLERQTADKDIMNKKPRQINSHILQKKLLLRSIIQGLVLFIFSFGAYYYYYRISDVYSARSLGLLILFLSNIFLVNVNASNQDFAFVSIKNSSHDKILWSINGLTILMILIIIYTPLNHILKLDSLTFIELLVGVLLAFISVFWIEIYKLIKIIMKRKTSNKSFIEITDYRSKNIKKRRLFHGGKF